MKEFDKILWGFIFSALGIAFGWTLNQIGQWIRTRQEDKKSIKVVLFNLLETYFLFVRSDLDKFVQKITDKVHSNLPEDQRSEESKSFINSLYSGIITEYLKPELSEKLDEVRLSYQASVKTLATIDPITAYYLSGKSNILDYFDSIQDWLESLKIDFPTEQNQIEIGAQQVLGVLKPDILNDALSELEKDIAKVAWKINPYVWFQSKRVIRRLKINVNQKVDKKIDELFEKLNPLFGEQ